MGNCLKRKQQNAKEFSEDENQQKKNQQEAPQPKPLKSWEIRRLQQQNKDDFVCRNKQDETVIKQPGSLNGLQYKIESCTNSEIYVLDHSTTIFVDDCTNCKIFIGPCKASVFVRDCKNCEMVIACQQYRSRDCQNIKTLLYCQSQPIIESCKNMQFGCFYFAYPQLNQQFKDCGINPWTNNWSDIYDFTKNPNGVLNYSYLPENEIEIIPYACEKLSSLCSREYCEEKQNLCVPITKGLRLNTNELSNSSIIMIYPEVTSKMADSLASIFNQRNDIQIIRTLHCKLQNDSRQDLIFNLEEKNAIFSQHDFSESVLFIQLQSENLKQALDDIFGKYSNQYYLWNKTKASFTKISKIIFENWEDERKPN
ncbi:hypothetical protein ABPG72_004477 [Tetrahymena utriculariae]